MKTEPSMYTTHMRKSLQSLSRRTALPLLALLCVASCTEDTDTMGLYPDGDNIINSHSVYSVLTRSLEMGAVRTASDINYLGEIEDPETGTSIRSEFAAQYFCSENYSFPALKYMFPIDTMLTQQPAHPIDSIRCDSVEVRLYFDSYYGDGSNPMKLEVYPMSFNTIMEEDSIFYSDIDLNRFVDAGTQPIATKVFSPIDYNLSESELNSATHSNNVRIVLPDTFGTRIMQQYYRQPQAFKDAYSFVRNVFPGFYFKLKSGQGNMIYVSVSTVNVFFSYYTAEHPDSAIAAMGRFASTPEVIQSTRFVNDDMQPLVQDNSCTYLKTPAGICTEVTLPVDDVFLHHESDSVSKAQLTFTRYNKADDSYALGTPQTVLLLRKQDVQSFFDNKEVSNNLTSYTTSFDATYNTYTFSNICRLLTYLQREKKTGMAAENLSEEQWKAAHPEWNKCVLIPVKTSTTSDAYGNSYQTSVTHDLDMNSIRLVGGSENPIQMQVIYSRFK